MVINQLLYLRDAVEPVDSHFNGNDRFIGQHPVDYACLARALWTDQAEVREVMLYFAFFVSGIFDQTEVECVLDLEVADIWGHEGSADEDRHVGVYAYVRLHHRFKALHVKFKVPIKDIGVNGIQKLHISYIT